MSGGLPSTSYGLSAIVQAVLICLSVSTTFAADPPDATKPADSTAPAPRLKDGYRLQEWDDLAMPFHPLKPMTAADQTRSDAVAWFMTGRLLETRNEPRKAVAAYRKAIALDPQAIEVYRQLVPLEFQLNDIEAAVLSATKAVEIDPKEHELLQLLGAQAANTGKLPDAIRYLEQAVQSQRIPRDSFEFLLLKKNLGVLYSATGQPEKAADCYEIVFDALVHPEKFHLDFRAKSRMLADPQSNYERIGQIFLDAKRIQLAEQAYELAAKSGRVGAGNLSFNRARVLLLSDKPDEALTELQKYLDAQKRTKGREAYQLLADILGKLKRTDELIARLEELASKDGHNLPLQFFLAERLVDVNELDKARQIYEAALPQGADPTGYIGLIRVLRKMQKPQELLELLERALTKLGPEGLAQLEEELKSVAEDANTVDALIGAAREQAKADPRQLTFPKAFLLAGLAKALDRTDDAVEFYRAAIKLNKEQSLSLYRELHNVLVKAHRYATSEEIFKEALAERRSAAERADLLGLLARSQLLNGKLQDAIDSIDEALRLEPGDVSHLFDEAWIYSHARQWDQAYAKFEKLRDMFPENKRLQRFCQFSLSNILVQKGEFRKGEEILEKILEVDPDDTQVNNDLGYLWADQGKNLDRAEKMIRKAVEAEPDNGAYLDSLGWLLFKQGKYEEAIGPIEQAVKKNTGGDTTLLDHLGDVQLKLMQTDKAVESWQKALIGAEADKFSDPQLVERLKDKLKQHGPKPNQPKPAEPGNP